MQRTLTTIGEMYPPSPLRRQSLRRSRTIGQTNPGFSAPASGALADLAGQPLQTAAFALQNQMDAYGVPSIHTSSPDVLAFQQAWNADPNAGGAGGNRHLDEDGDYGPNTSAALDAITGLAQAPNTGGATPVAPSPGPSPLPVTPTPATPTTPTAPAHGMTAGAWLVVGAAAAAAVYFLFFRKKKRTKHVSQAIVKVNPRRRRARR